MPGVAERAFPLSKKDLVRFHEKKPAYIACKFTLLVGLWLAFAFAASKLHFLPFQILFLGLAGFMVNGLIQLGHEAWHYNLFEGARKNEWFGHFLSLLFPILYEPGRHAHLLHHRYNRTEKDPDAYNVGKRSFGLFLLYYSVIFLGVPLAIIQFNIVYPLQAFTAKQRRRHWKILAVYVGIYSVGFFFIHQFHLWKPVCQLWLLPVLFSSPWNGLKSVSDHYGNDWKGSSFRTATTVRSNRLVTYLWNGLNYHLDHHFYPQVPGYHLPELHKKLRPAMITQRALLFESYFYVWFRSLKEGPTVLDENGLPEKAEFIR